MSLHLSDVVTLIALFQSPVVQSSQCDSLKYYTELQDISTTCFTMKGNFHIIIIIKFRIQP